MKIILTFCLVLISLLLLTSCDAFKIFNIFYPEVSTEHYLKGTVKDAAGNILTDASIYVVYDFTTLSKGINDSLIELYDFMIAEETEQHYINIRWKTVTESNMTGFYLLRNNANDLNSAYIISTLIPATNTNQPHEYSYLDTEVSSGSHYYWLKAVEADTIDSYYGPVVGVVTVTPGTPSDWGIHVSPNPVSNTCTIGYDVQEACLVQIWVKSLFDTTSITLFEGSRSSGRYWLNWNGQGLDEALVSNGYYVIQAQFKIENSVFEYWRSSHLFINNQQLNNKPYTKTTSFGYSIPIRKYLHPGDTFPTTDLSGNLLNTLQVSGNYTIYVKKAGYHTATRTISIPPSYKDITANFVLNPMVKKTK